MLTNNLLLDTHVWIWLMNGDSHLSKKSRELIENAHQQGRIFVSAISTWELGMLEKKQRIVLNKPCLEWIRVSSHFGIQLLDMTPEIAIESCQLPDYFQGDPADKMIIASARVEGLTLLTRDEHILAYGKKKLVATVKA